MMISPEMFADECREKSYAELLELRDEYMADIKAFEAAGGNVEVKMMPSPDVMYQMNLQYLGELCKVISEKYNQEYVWQDEDE